MNSDDTYGLYQDICLFEKREMLVERYDLNGNPVCSSHLNFFNRYLSETVDQHKGELKNTKLHFKDLGPENILGFCHYLYDRKDMRSVDMNLCIQELTAFLDYRNGRDQHFSIYDLDQIKKSLQRELKDVLRLNSIYRNLLKLQYRVDADPTESYDEDHEQMKLFAPKYPVASEELLDTWTVVSLRRKDEIAYFKGNSSEKKIAVTVGKTLMQRLRIGDMIPIRFGQTWDENYFVMFVDYPIRKKNIAVK